MNNDLNALIVQVSNASRELIDALQKGGLSGVLSIPNIGMRRSARLPLIAALSAELQRPIFLLTDRSDRVLTLADELALLSPETPRLIFPEPTPLYYEKAAWSENTRRDRLTVLTSLASYHIPGVLSSSGFPDRKAVDKVQGSLTIAPEPADKEHPADKSTQNLNPIIISSARAVMTRTIPRREFLKAVRILKPGQMLQPDEMARNLVYLAYEPVNTVIFPGQFARRGGILDLWPPAESQPVRVEFFGDEIDTLRCFDPATQRTSRVLKRVILTPAREYLVPLQTGQASHKTGNFEITGGLADTQLSEFFIPLIHETPACVLDYLPRHALVVIDNGEDLQNTVLEVEEQAVGLRADYIADGNLSPDFPVPYLSWSEIQDVMEAHQTLELGPAASPIETELDIGQEIGERISLQVVSERYQAGPRFGGRLKQLQEYLTQVVARGEAVIIVTRQAARLQELWKEQTPFALASISIAPPPLFIEGSLTDGFSLFPPGGTAIHLLTDGEIFGWRRPEPRQRHRPIASEPEAAYADLMVGDWVVHVDHGIGRFLGLVNRTVDRIEREYLAVEYAEGDSLYVPVHQADRLTRYVGPDSHAPTPTRLGGVEWRGTKVRVKEAVEEVAEDLLELYATRQVVQGYAFAADNVWQQELEASFPYVETDDQKRVINEVKRDMESSRPMDRLICGDVGYGKTEVALRAAFKAVMEGKQVAVLVPTTVLAQQHYNTFRERLAAFPIVVEMLSRFRNPQQQREILMRLGMGGVDIIIGTHRLLQGDVQFKDMGLLIIDEEQRFGVTHKEFLKKMRTEVDVLTLTATPIPRTLYMALTGVRDISTINTPPEERLPIITHVGPYSPRLVRQAILRELERGGQIFFVHNRVQTITAMHAHLAHLVPEVRVAIAHGQMPENELSDRMERFVAGDVDVLLSTSIIESGLDIPNANTLIVDRADTFGLAQLYQLRGRVGRGAQRAYAYFFKHARRLPSPEGRQRLETIAENTQLGAGYSIAMRDLEIRGTGDILGTRQHGQIAAVGFHLYTRLLADAVRRMRRESGVSDTPQTPIRGGFDAPLSIPVNVDLPLDIAITPDYVPDKNMRLRLYRRIADLRSLAEVDALVEEFSDRFGPPPEAARNLLAQLKIKLLAEKAGLAAVTLESDQIALKYRNDALPANLPYLGDGVRIGKTAIWLPYKTEPDWFNLLNETLERLSS